MRAFIRRVQAMLTAAAFAEEGDVDTARRMVREADGEQRRVPHPGRPDLGPVPSEERVALRPTA